jgi:hypothetical protein
VQSIRYLSYKAGVEQIYQEKSWRATEKKQNHVLYMWFLKSNNFIKKKNAKPQP